MFPGIPLASDISDSVKRLESRLGKSPVVCSTGFQDFLLYLCNYQRP